MDGMALAREIAEEVVLMPRRYRAGRSLTMYQILAASGYFENHALVDEELIKECLVLAPELVEEWRAWSEDQRSYGWYFRESAGGCEVGYIGPGARECSVEYSDKFDACAAYVKNEIEVIRESYQKLD